MLDKIDHDLLICIDVKLKEMKAQFDNHLKHHWAITMCAFGTALSAFVCVVVILLRG